MKNKWIKKYIALALSAVMIAGSVSVISEVRANAQENGEGTEGNATENTDTGISVQVIVENLTYPQWDGAAWDGELFDVNVDVAEGTTVKEALAAACDEAEVEAEEAGIAEGDGEESNEVNYSATIADSAYGAYVSAIGGLAAGDGGQSAGWIYSVNGTEAEVGIDDYTLQDEDVVIFDYTCAYTQDADGSWVSDVSKINKDLSADDVQDALDALDEVEDLDEIKAGLTNVKALYETLAPIYDDDGFLADEIETFEFYLKLKEKPEIANLTATYTDGVVELSWDQAEGASGYFIDYEIYEDDELWMDGEINELIEDTSYTWDMPAVIGEEIGVRPGHVYSADLTVYAMNTDDLESYYEALYGDEDEGDDSDYGEDDSDYDDDTDGGDDSDEIDYELLSQILVACPTTVSYEMPGVGEQIGKVRIKTTSCTYTGAVKKATVMMVYDTYGFGICDWDEDLNGGSYYTVSYSAASPKAVGTYKAIVTGQNGLSGSAYASYKILPVKTAISSLAKGTKSFTVKWTKKSTQVTGYQIQYSLYKDFRSYKLATVTSYKTTSRTIKSLKSKKYYYVRVRTYKKVNGKAYYSGWSATKYVKTK